MNKFILPLLRVSSVMLKYTMPINVCFVKSYGPQMSVGTQKYKHSQLRFHRRIINLSLYLFPLISHTFLQCYLYQRGVILYVGNMLKSR